MRKIIVGFSILLVLMIPLVVLAVPGKNGKLGVKPSVSDPDKTGVVVSAWMPHQGINDAGKSDHALYFQKDDVTSVNASALARVTPFEGKAVSTLLELGFDYKNGGHCTTGAPRFVVNVDGADYLLGCASGIATVSPDNPNWTRVRFKTTEFSAAGIPVSGTINSLKMVFDEGTDLGPGFIYMDQIDVNGTLIGKSGKGGPKK